MESDMTLREKLKGKELKAFCFFSMAMLFVAAMAGMIQEGQGPLALIRGLWTIIISRDALITDYFELAGHGAAFLNGVLVMGMGMWLLCREKVKFTGLTMAAVFINVGYGFWGKNPVNILPILFGTSAYALVHGAQLSRYIYTGFFGTSLAPLVTELVYELPFDWRVNLLISIAAGMAIGFILPGLSVHTASMHMGYNLFNVGFSAGILAFVIVCVLKSFGIESESVMIWREGRPLWIAAGLYGYFLLTFLYGLYLCGGKWKGIGKVWKHPGRAVADFVLMEGEGNTLMNMALMGALLRLLRLRSPCAQLSAGACRRVPVHLPEPLFVDHARRAAGFRLCGGAGAHCGALWHRAWNPGGHAPYGHRHVHLPDVRWAESVQQRLQRGLGGHHHGARHREHPDGIRAAEAPGWRS